MKRTLLLGLGIILTCALMGCETVKGVGKDLQNTGDNIYDLATGNHRI